jgi:hypothetical protein
MEEGRNYLSSQVTTAPAVQGYSAENRVSQSDTGMGDQQNADFTEGSGDFLIAIGRDHKLTRAQKADRGDLDGTINHLRDEASLGDRR